MDTEATLALDHARLSELEDTLFQADFYLSQAMECRTDATGMPSSALLKRQCGRH